MQQPFSENSRNQARTNSSKNLFDENFIKQHLLKNIGFTEHDLDDFQEGQKYKKALLKQQKKGINAAYFKNFLKNLAKFIVF